ncbi:MAG: signal transduction histidine kinase [Acidobacteria bacterium]|nr:signal transduction histidine kinase [Acidobacteriota bacterium]
MTRKIQDQRSEGGKLSGFSSEGKPGSHRPMQEDQSKSKVAEVAHAIGGQAGITTDLNDREHLIEELKHRTAALEVANKELRRVSHYRTLFLGRMSHELRTPLTSILGFTEILLDHEQLSDTQRRFCQKIQDSGLQLQASLDQLVDLSHIEAGRTELFLQEFSLREAVRDSCAAVARLADRHEVRIDCELAPEPTTIVSDMGRLRQILYSFLAWGVSRSSAGQSVNLRTWLARPGSLNISLDDAGARIEDLARAFDPEERTGSGELPNLDELGVIIGRRLVDMLGGTVTLENLETAGARVTIELPISGEGA